MKITILLACACTILSKKEVVGAAIKAPLDIISLDDITPEERKELAYLQHKLGRPKRSGSGSGDLLETLKNAIGQGIKNKIGQIAQGSAAASARLSSSSSGASSGHGYSHHPPPPEDYDHKSFDFWSLKKSILNTLLQAVKAIKGGVIAVKGQLIKGGGHLISAKGKLISAKGEAITHLGKNIATSAVLVPYHGHSSSGHEDYGPPPHESHYSAPSAPEDIYHGSPSAPGPEYHEPEHYPSHHDEHAPHGAHDGILILKKITGEKPHHHHVEESKVPAFKPIAPAGPSFGAIVGKFLSASSTLDPHKPEPFGNTASADAHYASPSHSESHHYHEEPDTFSYKGNDKVPPGAAGFVIDDEPPKKEVIFKTPESSYGTFEKEPSYLDQSFDDHSASSSIKNPQAVKSNSISVQNIQEHAKKPSASQELAKPGPSFLSNNFEYPAASFQSLPSPSSSSGTFSGGNYNPYSVADLPNIRDYPNGFPASASNLPIAQSAKGELPASFLDQPPGANQFGQAPIDLTDLFQQAAPDYMAQESFSNEVPHFLKHLPKPTPFLQTPKQELHLPTPHDFHKPPTRLIHSEPKPSSSKHKHKTSPSGRPTSPKRPSSTRTTHKHKPKQTYDVVRSVAYQLGPHGPTRLT